MDTGRMNLEEFQEWIDQNEDEAFAMMGAASGTKSLGKWLKAYSSTLGMLVKEANPDDEDADDEIDSLGHGGGIFGDDQDY